MIISIDANNFDKIQHLFMIKILSKLDIERMYLNIMKTIYNKSETKIALNDEKLKVFHIRSGIIQRGPLLPILFNTVMEVLTRVIR